MTQAKASTFSPDPLVGETERQFARIQIRRDLAENRAAQSDVNKAVTVIGIESDTADSKLVKRR